MTEAGAVVVTGMGIVSPLGIGVQAFRQGLLAGGCAIKPPLDGASAFPVARVGSSFDPAAYVRSKALKYVGRASQMLSAALSMALGDAGVSRVDDEVAMVIGTSMGNFPQTAEYSCRIVEGNPTRLSPMNGFDAAQNSAVSFASAVCKVRGCVRTVATGWTSSARAIEIAWHMVRQGIARVVAAGGVEQVAPLMTALYQAQGLPVGRRCAAPFDRGRAGLCLGEGSYVLVLEEARCACARSARIYGEIVSAGSSEAHLPAAPVDAWSRAMIQALSRAGISAREVDAVSAAASSTVAGDLAEGLAIAGAVGDQVPVVAIKSSIGESCGAAAAAQAAQALLSVYHGELPPVPGLEELDPAVGIKCLVTRERRGSYRNILVNTADPVGSFHSLLIRRAN